MTRRVGILGVLTLALMAVAGDLHAQDRSFAFGLGGGATFPLGEIGDEFEAGLHINGLVQSGALGALPFGLRGEVGYQTFSHDDDTLRHIVGRVNAVIPFAGRSDAQPYLIAGVGLYNSKEETDHGDHTHGGEAENFLGLNAGVGIRWSLGGLNTFVEARFHNVFDDHHAQRFIPFSLGILF
jgi:hypothetical protein